MFRTVIISLVVLMVAGCVTGRQWENDPTWVAHQAIYSGAVALEADGKITESEKYRRIHFSHSQINPRFRRAYDGEYYLQRLKIAEAYETKTISTSKYFELKQAAINWKSSMDAATKRSAIRGRKEADRRWDNFMSAMQGLQNELDRPRREQNEFNRNLPLPNVPSMHSNDYPTRPVGACLNGLTWTMDSAGRWECQ